MNIIDKVFLYKDSKHLYNEDEQLVILKGLKIEIRERLKKLDSDSSNRSKL